MAWLGPGPPAAAEGPWPPWRHGHHGSARSPAPLPQPEKGLSASLRLWLGYSCRVNPGCGSPRWCRDAHAGSGGCQLSSHAAGAGPAPGAKSRRGAGQAAGAAGQSPLALVGDRAPVGLDSVGRRWPALGRPQRDHGAHGGRDWGHPRPPAGQGAGAAAQVSAAAGSPGAVGTGAITPDPLPLRRMRLLSWRYWRFRPTGQLLPVGALG